MNRHHQSVRSRGRTWRLVVVVLTGLALVLTACGDSPDPADDEVSGDEVSGDAGTSASEVATSDAPSDDGQGTIGVNLPFTENDPWIPLMAGAEEQAAARGYELLRSSSNGDIETQINELNTWVAQGVDGMTIFPLDPSTLGPIVDKAQEAGIEIVAYASPVEGAGGQNLFDDQRGGEALGEAAAAYAEANFDGQPKVAYITQDDCEVCRIRSEAMLGKLQELLPDTEVVAEAEGRTAPEALEFARPILEANPDVNMFLVHNDPPCAGISQAVQAAGRELGSVWCGGMDGAKIWLDKLLSGEAVGASGALDLVQIGRDTVNVAANLIEGDGPTETVQEYEILTHETPDRLEEFIAQYDVE